MGSCHSSSGHHGVTGQPSSNESSDSLRVGGSGALHDDDKQIMFDSVRITKSLYKKEMTPFQQRRWGTKENINANNTPKVTPCRRLVVRDSVFAEDGGDGVDIPANERRFLKFLSTYSLEDLDSVEFSCSPEAAALGATGPLHTSAVCLMLPNFGCNDSVVNLRELIFSTTLWPEERDFIGLCLCKVLRCNPKLEVVHLALRTDESVELGDTAVGERMNRVAQGLMALDHLRELSLIGSSTEDVHLRKILRAMGLKVGKGKVGLAERQERVATDDVYENINLQKLSLSNNDRLTSESLHPLTHTLKFCSQLRSLDLSGCQNLFSGLNDETQWAPFMEAVSHSGLRSLSLKGCGLNDDMNETIFKRLATSGSTLQHLDLSSNLDFSLCALETLVKYLPDIKLTFLNMYNTSMYNLTIPNVDEADGNPIDSNNRHLPIRLALYQALAKNTSLVHIELGHVGMRHGDDGSGQIDCVYGNEYGDAEIVSKISERNVLLHRALSVLEFNPTVDGNLSRGHHDTKRIAERKHYTELPLGLWPHILSFLLRARPTRPRPSSETLPNKEFVWPDPFIQGLASRSNKEQFLGKDASYLIVKRQASSLL